MHDTIVPDFYILSFALAYNVNVTHEEKNEGHGHGHGKNGVTSVLDIRSKDFWAKSMGLFRVVRLKLELPYREKVF
jgi:hypothetical protein